MYVACVRVRGAVGERNSVGGAEAPPKAAAQTPVCCACIRAVTLTIVIIHYYSLNTKRVAM